MPEWFRERSAKPRTRVRFPSSPPSFLLAHLVVLALLAAACQAEADPTPPAVLLPGQVAEDACQSAVVARAEAVRDEGPAGAGAFEAEIFATCTYDEFRVANAKMADGYRYPGDGRSYVGRNCLRVFALYRGSRLCQTR